MSLLDQFGRDVTHRRFAHSLNSNRRHGLLTYLSRDRGVNKEVPPTDRRSLVALARRLSFNSGVMSAAERQKAMVSVGRAFVPTYRGEDRKRGELATRWLVDDWFPRPTFSAGMDWWEMLRLLSRMWDRDGEIFVKLARRDDGWPALQPLPPGLVRCETYSKEPERVTEGPFAGRWIEDGVIFNDARSPVGYRVYRSADDSDGFEDWGVGEVFHDFTRQYPEQMRGYPAASAGLADLLAAMTSKELELNRQQVVSSVYLMAKGIDIDPDDPRFTEVASSTEVELGEDLCPGVRHIRNDQALETLKHESPGDIFRNFRDDVYRELINPWWVYELVWRGAGQGTDARVAVVRGRHHASERQDALDRVCTRAVAHAAAHAERAGLIGGAPNSARWHLSRPARLTADDGREAKTLLEAVQEGAVSYTQYLAFMGRSLREQLTEKANELAEAEEIARVVGDARGVTIDPRQLHPQFKKPGNDDNPPTRTDPAGNRAADPE